MRRVSRRETELVLPRLMPGVKYNLELVEKLTRLAADAENARNPNNETEALFFYVNCCTKVAEQLALQLRAEEVERLVLTRTHWAIRQLVSGRPPGLIPTIDLELVACKIRLKDSADAIKLEISRWPAADFVIVPDTNVLVHVTNGDVSTVDWHSLLDIAPNEDLVVVMLMAVIDELDRHKRSTKADVRQAARRALKQIDSLFPNSTDPVSVQPARYAEGGEVTVMLMTDNLGHVPLGTPDGEIIDRALDLEARTSGRVLLLTGDTGAAIRARTAGLQCHKIATPDPNSP